MKFEKGSLYTTPSRRNVHAHEVKRSIHYGERR